MQVSEDGLWVWNGTEWVPNENAETAQASEPEVEQVSEPAVAEAPAAEVAAAPAMAEPAVAAAPAMQTQAMPMQAMGGTGEWKIQTANYGLFFTKVIAFLLTAVTLGFGLPWAKCMVMNKWANNVRIDGRRIKFTGTAGQLVGVWIKVFLLSVVTIGLYYIFAGYKAINKYIDANITWA